MWCYSFFGQTWHTFFTTIACCSICLIASSPSETQRTNMVLQLGSGCFGVVLQPPWLRLLHISIPELSMVWIGLSAMATGKSLRTQLYHGALSHTVHGVLDVCLLLSIKTIWDITILCKPWTYKFLEIISWVCQLCEHMDAVCESAVRWL